MFDALYFGLLMRTVHLSRQRKKDKQWRYVSEYADAHGLLPIKIVRRGYIAPMVANQMFFNCLDMMRQGNRGITGSQYELYYSWRAGYL